MADRRVGPARGQSEVLGFIFVFATVLTAIALISATGFAGIQDAQRFEQANNAVRAFEVLDGNVDSIVQGRSPHRGTEVKLAASQLTFGDPVDVTVSGERTTDSSQNFSYNTTVRPLEFDVGDTTLVYVGGAIIHQERGGTILRRAPSLVFTDSEVVLPIVQVRSLDTTGVGGSQTVYVRTSLAEKRLVAAETKPYRVEYSITSDQADAWETYFDSTGATVTRSGDTVRAEIVTDRVYVTDVRINATFE